MIHFGAEAQQNVMQLTAVNFFHCFANDTFRSRSSAKRHAAESCKFFPSLTVVVNRENNLDSSTEKEMMLSMTVGYG